MSPIRLPEDVAACLDRLRRAGFAAYPVGGCVRDGLLGRPCSDWDVCTAAPAGALRALFPAAEATGDYGTVRMAARCGAIEITPFRREGPYRDGRHPDYVSFEATLLDDLRRRDFTVNAMALGEDGAVIDPFGGMEDLARRLVRCVGAAEERFREDGLRLFRAARFSAQLDFEIEGKTLAALGQCAFMAQHVSGERAGGELEGALLSPAPGRLEPCLRLGLLGRWLDAGADRVRLSGGEGLPMEGAVRWAWLCAALSRAGSLADPAAFLSALGRSRETVTACTGALSLLARGAPSSGEAWRCAIVRYGRGAASAAAALLGERAAFAAAAPEGTCLHAADLALTGGALYRLGLRGAAIGRAQRAMLQRVLERPEDNRADTLLAYLRGQGYI